MQDVKLIVIACGTATSQALEELRKIYKIPIIGIIEPTIENCIKEDTKSVGIIATKGTIRSGEWEKQIKLKNSNIETGCDASLLINIQVCFQNFTVSEVLSVQREGRTI